METAYPLQGLSVELRPFEREDLPALRQMLNRPGAIGRRYLGIPDDRLLPISSRELNAMFDEWTRPSLHRLAVVRREAQTLIGHASFDDGWDPHSPEIELMIGPTNQAKGFGREALGLLLNYLFAFTPAHNVSAWAAEWNERAIRFLEHAGFTMVGRLRRAGIRDGLFYDDLVFDMLRPEWVGTEGAADADRG